MREIKFRGKRKDNGEWIYGLVWLKKPRSKKVFISYFPDDDDNEDVVVIDSRTLGQYTGLKDKNRVEIFEGDIVNHYWSNEVGESFCHKTVIKNPFDYKVNEAMHLIYADELEILGNIYENSELLEA